MTYFINSDVAHLEEIAFLAEANIELGTTVHY